MSFVTPAYREGNEEDVICDSRARLVSWTWWQLGRETQEFVENDNFPFLLMIHASAWNSNLGTELPVYLKALGTS